MRRLLLIALVLVGIAAFAVEPTTSTEFDMQEGRAHGAYFHSISPGARIAQAVDPMRDLRVPATPTALATLLALVFTSAPFIAAVATRVPGESTLLRWAAASRRGPPARAF